MIRDCNHPAEPQLTGGCGRCWTLVLRPCMIMLQSADIADGSVGSGGLLGSFNAARLCLDEAAKRSDAANAQST
jgi:hypothetical protein